MLCNSMMVGSSRGTMWLTSAKRYFGTSPGGTTPTSKQKNKGAEKFKSLGSGFARHLQKDISTATVVAQSTATVAKQVAEEVAHCHNKQRHSTLGGAVITSVANVAASSIPVSIVTPTTANLVPPVFSFGTKARTTDDDPPAIGSIAKQGAHSKFSPTSPREARCTTITGSAPTRVSTGTNHHEHCLLGWSPNQIYSVVADVGEYSAFLPWCVSSSVDSSSEKMVVSDCEGDGYGAQSPCLPQMRKVREMTATLGVGFSFLRESYASQVHLDPGSGLIQATLHGKSTMLRELRCTWYFGPLQTSNQLLTAMSGCPNANAARNTMLREFVDERELNTAREVILALREEGTVRSSSLITTPDLITEAEQVLAQVANVKFEVGFDFRNPLHQSFMSAMVMSNVVTVMTKSFEARCRELYGAPLVARKGLPLNGDGPTGNPGGVVPAAVGTK